MRIAYLSNIKMIKVLRLQDKKISHLIEYLIWILDKVKYTIRLQGQLLIPYLKDSMAQYLHMAKLAQEKLIQCKFQILWILMFRE